MIDKASSTPPSSITTTKEQLMPKAYIVSCYLEHPDEDRLAKYAGPAKAAFDAHGGRFVVRATPSHIFEAGQNMRTIVIEFDSLAQAKAAYESDEYQRARAILGDIQRDVRIVEGV